MKRNYESFTFGRRISLNSEQNCMDIETVLDCLPYIKKSNARTLLEETLGLLQSEYFADRGEFTDMGYVEISCDRPAEYYTTELFGVMLTLPELDSWFVEQGVDRTSAVSPASASRIVRLYRAGAFEMNKNRSPVKPAYQLL